MIIGDRLRAVREEKNLSQGNIEARTGLLRCYVSRVENGHTIPSLETLEKFSRALETPLYLLLYEEETTPTLPIAPHRKDVEIVWGDKGKDIRALHRLRTFLGQMKESDRQLLYYAARQMAIHRAVKKRRNKSPDR
jgi:transcriptional regulator with XRE-family HTH domain